MKALSLMQPYASLVILGFKKLETRSWRTNYRGPLLIHSSRSYDRSCIQAAYHPVVAAFFKEQGFRCFKDLPRGGLLGTVSLERCFPVDSIVVSEREALVGDFSPLRFAWKVADPQPFVQPVPWTGNLGREVSDDKIADCGLQSSGRRQVPLGQRELLG